VPPGPVPKPKHLRRNPNPLRAGEWIDLEPLDKPVLGPYNRKTMTVREAMWNAWRRSPETGQYGDADIQAIYELAIRWADLTFADQDRRMHALGLTPKAKRDLRWRTPNEVKTIRKQEAQAQVRKLHIAKEGKP